MRRLSYYFNETINSLRRQGLMVFAAVSTVFISLFLFGGALLIGKEVNLILDYTTEKVQVAVFLQDSVSNADRTRLYNMLQQMPEVASVRYESKQEAYQRFKQIFKSEHAITQNVTAQAIPASFQVRLKDPSKFSVVAARLTGQPGIENIRDNRDILNKFFAVARILRLGALIAGVVVLASAATLIGNTVRMGVFARRKEIGIMRLVGATNWFIRIPFLIEGAIEGLIGSGAAIITLFVLRRLFFNSIHNYILFWPVIPTSEVVLYIPILVGIGMAVAILASFVAMRRFLEV
jgi:cell division transport system permease protein